MAVLMLVRCPRCCAECTVMPAFNAPQMGHCTKCNKLFQFTVAVRTIDKSSAGEVRTGDWKVLGAPTIEEIHKSDILYRFGKPED